MSGIFKNRMVVVGSGVIGVAAALRMQRAGYPTLLVDRNEPGRGCSYGNAGVIATSFVLPLSSPRHILTAPRMIADPLGPLAIRFAHLPSITPWLLQFLLNATPTRQRQTTDSLKALNGRALKSWTELLGSVGLKSMLIERGMLEVVHNADEMPGLRANAAKLSAEGVRLQELAADEVNEVEPILRNRVAGGVLHLDVAHTPDPYGLTLGLFNRFREAGGEFRLACVTRVEPSSDAVQISIEGGSMEASYAVIAAGLGSKSLVEALGLRVPIGVEFGYHLMLPNVEEAPSRPISFHSESFLAVPMVGGLRLAGTVELARADASPNWKRSAQLFELACRYIPAITIRGATQWRGGRPSFPDGLPAIGRACSSGRIIYAFGHQHLGLTQAAITAECIHALLRGGLPPLPLQPLSLERFGFGKGRLSRHILEINK